MEEIKGLKDQLEKDKKFVGILKKTNIYLYSNLALSFIATLISNHILTFKHPLTIAFSSILTASLYASMPTTILEIDKGNEVKELEEIVNNTQLEDDIEKYNEF